MPSEPTPREHTPILALPATCHHLTAFAWPAADSPPAKRPESRASPTCSDAVIAARTVNRLRPVTTMYNHRNRWRRREIWACIRAALTQKRWISETAQIDSSCEKAHRCSGAAKRGSSPAIGTFARRPHDYDYAFVDLLDGRPASS